MTAFYEKLEADKLQLQPIGVPKLGDTYVLTANNTHLLDFENGHNIPMTVNLYLDNAPEQDEELADRIAPCLLHELESPPLHLLSTATGHHLVSYEKLDWKGHCATLANTYGQPMLMALDRTLPKTRVYYEIFTNIRPGDRFDRRRSYFGHFDIMVMDRMPKALRSQELLNRVQHKRSCGYLAHVIFPTTVDLPSQVPSGLQKLNGRIKELGHKIMRYSSGLVFRTEDHGFTSVLQPLPTINIHRFGAQALSVAILLDYYGHQITNRRLENFFICSAATGVTVPDASQVLQVYHHHDTSSCRRNTISHSSNVRRISQEHRLSPMANHLRAIKDINDKLSWHYRLETLLITPHPGVYDDMTTYANNMFAAGPPDYDDNAQPLSNQPQLDQWVEQIQTSETEAAQPDDNMAMDTTIIKSLPHVDSDEGIDSTIADAVNTAVDQALAQEAAEAHNRNSEAAATNSVVQDFFAQAAEADTSPLEVSTIPLPVETKTSPSWLRPMATSTPTPTAATTTTEQPSTAAATSTVPEQRPVRRSLLQQLNDAALAAAAEYQRHLLNNNTTVDVTINYASPTKQARPHTLTTASDGSRRDDNSPPPKRRRIVDKMIEYTGETHETSQGNIIMRFKRKRNEDVPTSRQLDEPHPAEALRAAHPVNRRTYWKRRLTQRYQLQKAIITPHGCRCPKCTYKTSSRF